MRKAIKPVLAALLLLVLTGVLLVPASWQTAPTSVESFSAIGQVLFGQYLLAFEILSVLLLAALIGAIWLARKGVP